ncbi:MAG: hypothetical protein M3O50_06415 [Myxococcota bacterium]|nr:hypothetical protein [Myxococcota bacterium]
MSDTPTLVVGAFSTLWVVLFFGFSAVQIRRSQERASALSSDRRKSVEQ